MARFFLRRISSRSTSGFQTRRIRRKTRPYAPKKTAQARLPNFQKSELRHITLLAIIILVTAVLIVHGIAALNLSSWFSILSGTFGKELEIDEKGRTNILLLGSAGEGFEGKDLTDSIILVSFHQRENKVALLSIPRDLYVETKETGGNRINRLYELGSKKFGDEGGLEFARYTISQFFDIPIHYVWKVDFKGFAKMVDAIGGITLNVPETIDDPLYPKDGTYDYEHFYLPAGLQKLDGKTALKYVRSRHTTSDFSRSNRQQEVLLAMKKQALEEGVLTSPSQLKAVYRALREHIDTNMDLREMITLAKVGARMDQGRIFHFSIHDDPTITGGFLYTPLRELYGGAFVLLPASDKWDEIKKYAKLVTDKPEWLKGSFSVQVLNGTKTAGIATSLKIILQRYGFSVPRFGNARAQGIPVTTLYIKNPDPKVADAAASLFKELFSASDVSIADADTEMATEPAGSLPFHLAISKNPPEKYLNPPYASGADAILELGENFLPVFDKLDVFRYVVSLTPSEILRPQITD